MLSDFKVNYVLFSFLLNVYIIPLYQKNAFSCRERKRERLTDVTFNELFKSKFSTDFECPFILIISVREILLEIN